MPLKKTTILLTLLMLTASVSFAKTKHSNKNYRIISTKSHTLFFKVKKSFVGGVVEVYDANNNFLEADELPHTHTKVHFDHAPAGDYMVIISKGSKSVKLMYYNI